MNFSVNRRTGSLAQRVRDDLRLLSSDTKGLLRQALSEELPAARQQLLNVAGDSLGRGREWIRNGVRSFRREDRTPYLLGAVGLAVLAGAAWCLWSRSSCCRSEVVPDDEIADEP